MPAAPFPKTYWSSRPPFADCDWALSPPASATTLGRQQRRRALPLARLVAEKHVLPQQGAAGTSLRVHVPWEETEPPACLWQGRVRCFAPTSTGTTAGPGTISYQEPSQGAPGSVHSLGALGTPSHDGVPSSASTRRLDEGLGTVSSGLGCFLAGCWAGLGTPSTAGTLHSGFGCLPGLGTRAAQGSSTEDNLGPGHSGSWGQAQQALPEPGSWEVAERGWAGGTTRRCPWQPRETHGLRSDRAGSSDPIAHAGPRSPS